MTAVVRAPEPIPVEVTRRTGYDTAVWATACVIATELVLFGGLLSAYFFLRATSPTWPPAGTEVPKLDWAPWVFSAVLIGSSLPLFPAERAERRGRRGALRVWLALSWVMGAAFIGWTIYDFTQLKFGWTDSAYASVYWTTIGLHALHVTFGLIFSATLQLKARTNRPIRTPTEVFVLYWHFVDVVWVLVFTSLFISPHL